MRAPAGSRQGAEFWRAFVAPEDSVVHVTASVLQNIFPASPTTWKRLWAAEYTTRLKSALTPRLILVQLVPLELVASKPFSPTVTNLLLPHAIPSRLFVNSTLCFF